MKATPSRISFVFVCFLAAFVGSCGYRVAEKLTPQEAAVARQTIMEWLGCEECTDGELDKVVALGGIAVPSLAAVLEKTLSPARRELLRRQAIADFRKLKDYEKAHPENEVSMKLEAYVEHVVKSAETKHRVRSILGLAAIGGQDATQALQSARSLPLSSYERDHLERALANAL